MAGVSIGTLSWFINKYLIVTAGSPKLSVIFDCLLVVSDPWKNKVVAVKKHPTIPPAKELEGL